MIFDRLSVGGLRIKHYSFQYQPRAVFYHSKDEEAVAMNISINTYIHRRYRKSVSLLHYSMIGVFCLFMLAMNSAIATPQCGTFEMVEIPGRVSMMEAFPDGTIAAIGSSAQNPATQVIRYFDGQNWSNQNMPAEADGFIFGSSGSTPDGDAWFAGTRAVSVYELEVIMMRVVAGSVDRVDTFIYPSSITTPGAPRDISGSSFDNVWAVTASGNALYFDGSDWAHMDVPDIFVDQILEGTSIYTAGYDDVWIAGSGSSGKNADQAYVQHWNGSSWNQISAPFAGQNHTYFNDIDGSGPNDIWIAGEDWVTAGNLLLHWDGSSWTQSTGAGSVPTVARVMAMEPGNAWAVPKQSGLLYYWDGSSWKAASGLDFPESAVTISMRDAAKASTCDAWVMGDYHDGTAYQPWAARLIPDDVTPPPPPVEDPTVYASAIDVSRIKVDRKTYYGQSIVTVLDNNGLPVSGAIVTGDFSGPTTERKSTTTDADGKAILNSSTVNRPRGNWCFSVAVITAPGAAYNASMNTVDSACEGNNDSGGGKRGKRK